MFATVIESTGKRCVDSKPEDGAKPDLKVVWRNFEWRLRDTKEILNKAFQKLEFKRTLEELYMRKCDVIEKMDELGGAGSFKKFEHAMMNLSEKFVFSGMKMRDCEKFHGALTGKLRGFYSCMYGV